MATRSSLCCFILCFSFCFSLSHHFPQSVFSFSARVYTCWSSQIGKRWKGEESNGKAQMFNPSSFCNTKSMASFKPSIPPTSNSSTSDEVHVTMGPMFAGKTTALLCRIKLEGNSGRNVAMIKSSKDTRYAIDAVGTHDGEKFLCWALSDLLSFRHNFGGDAYDKLWCSVGFFPCKDNFAFWFLRW